jgi:hypothetical protein
MNCTYSGLASACIGLRTPVKRELTELVLIRPPPALVGIGITVMDGPFFSTMPFPAARAHSLSHVRYTPHGASSLAALDAPVPLRSNRIPMVRDASRYLPLLANVEVIGSLFEFKVLLNRNEEDDGRPILIEESEHTPRILSIMGSKLDNIFDALEYVGSIQWSL